MEHLPRRLGRRAAVCVAAAALAGAAILVGAEARSRTIPLTGDLLVASPDMRDPRFARTVIYMVQHDSAGAMGLVVNRPLAEVPLAQLLERFGLESAGASGTIRLHAGGPVEPTRGFALHTADYAREGSQVVKDGIALSTHAGIFSDIAAGSGPRRVLVALGYAGWAPGQLEAEIANGHWVRVPADEALVFGDDYGEKWDKAMARRRIQI